MHSVQKLAPDHRESNSKHLLRERGAPALTSSSCSIKLSFAQTTTNSFPAERGKTLIQKKPTIYASWKSTFDAHIYEGRVLEVVLMQSAEEVLAKATVGISVLAERCKKSNTNGCAEFWLDLIPSGKVQVAVQYFLEDTDARKAATSYLSHFK